jgi:hypothetical protein
VAAAENVKMRSESPGASTSECLEDDFGSTVSARAARHIGSKRIIAVTAIVVGLIYVLSPTG